MLFLLPPDIPTSDQARLWRMRPAVMVSFCRPAVATGFPYRSAFQSRAQAWNCNGCNDVVVWEFPTVLQISFWGLCLRQALRPLARTAGIIVVQMQH